MSEPRRESELPSLTSHIATASDAAACVKPEPPARRLSIAHLLLWMAGTAATLAFFREQFASPEDSRSIRLIQQAYAFLLAPFCGAALASLPLAAWDWCAGRRSFPCQPGHWLLVVHGVGFFALAGAVLRISIPREISSYDEVIWYVSLREVIHLLPTFFVALVPTLLVGGRRWRWMFSLMTAGYGLAGGFYAARLLFGHVPLYEVGTSFLWILQTLSIFALVICVLGDRQAARHRDYLHTTGVVVRFAIVALGWALPWAIFLVAR